MDTNAQISRLSAMLGGPHDGPLLRFGLGNACLQAGRPTEAIEHYRACLARDEGFSAAWKQLGKALAAEGQAAEALAVYRRGHQIATDKGDLQAAKEMAVFIRRLEKAGE
ncbi:tetratricopeptide repeat protein [Denitromonas iodatirespirans]|uniref:Tetratricopeptide repeat protein n=1 Tax=Denitromonas iodatirespirans TaxID=2795389 RepID=A0A944H917_DENI1|nr:tetratricopeptide repeat protein [Denitromonas iodatirespirans]MBT0962784.1 tetratricopeptide repeat protein [Denitromonas iodatirespirans]